MPFLELEYLRNDKEELAFLKHDFFSALNFSNISHPNRGGAGSVTLHKNEHVAKQHHPTY
jgi:hypothetical protein